METAQSNQQKSEEKELAKETASVLASILGFCEFCCYKDECKADKNKYKNCKKHSK